MKLRYPITLVLVFAALSFAACSAWAADVDPHGLYERRCAGCHLEHAGDFVQESILRADGELIGKTNGIEVRAFLMRGHGKLSPAEVEVMMAHLTAILEAGALFQDRCVICHGRAVDFARLHLGMRDGVLIGRYSGHLVAEFLTGHGRLEPSEIETVVEALARQVSGPDHQLN